MNEFIVYSLLAAVLWGIMGVVESVAGQYSMYASLLLKYLLFGVAGAIFLFCLRGYDSLESDLEQFASSKPELFALHCVTVSLGLLGTYFAYRAFGSCGQNKGIAIIIAYCVPVVIVAFASYMFLDEKYNRFAVLGILLILGGVLVIDIYGINSQQKGLPQMVVLTTAPTRTPVGASA
jgi:drug/metabolite transporter (DMT)-like permease